MRDNRRSTFRRTRRTAVAVGAASLLSLVITDPGSAAVQQAAFSNGTGSATALGYKVNPTNGNLSFGITAGESVAGHQNTSATGQSRAINLGVIGVTLGGEGCDGGEATLPADKQPQPVIARTGEDGAAEGKHETEKPGGIEKYARANADPYAEAITSIAPMGDKATLYIDGGRTITHSGVINGNTREALARTELGTVSIGGGAVKLEGLVWQAIHRSGAVNETQGTFSMGSLVIAGKPQPLPADGLQQAAALNDLLKPVGLAITPPKVRVEEGIVFVDPLKIGVIPSAQRDAVLGGLIGGLQPVRAAVTDAILKADCGNSTYITVADLVIGSFSGAGAVALELGGVQATTGDFEQFQFGPMPALPSLSPAAPAATGSSVGGGGSGANFGSSAAADPAPTATTAEAPSTADSPPMATQAVAGITGERGGVMALVGGAGLLLLLATAEADRRKMQGALRQIPLEA